MLVLGSLGHLAGLLGTLTLALSYPTVPGWDQYVNIIEDILKFLASGLGNAGVAVIVFTLIIKTVLVPLTVQSLRSARAMQDLQPKIKELQKKFGKDRQRLSAETMKLYSEHHVNPMSGCLPMVIQMPIFWGLYRAIWHLSKTHTGVWGGGFLWMHDLAHADPYHILPILAGIFQFVQTKMTRPAHQGKPADSQQAMMNQMMNFMPLMVVLFGWKFAAGPVIYWVTQSAFSVVQQWFITGWGSMHDWFPWLPELPEHKRLGYRPPKPAEDLVVVSGEDGAVAAGGGVMGWFNRKMAEAQAQAQDRQTEARGRGGTGTSTKRTAYQAKVDAATRAAADAEAEPEGEAAAKPGGKRAKSRSAARRRAVSEARAPASAASATNGRTAPPNGASRPVVVPRKSRPARKKADGVGDG